MATSARTKTWSNQLPIIICPLSYLSQAGMWACSQGKLDCHHWTTASGGCRRTYEELLFQQMMGGGSGFYSKYWRKRGTSLIILSLTKWSNLSVILREEEVSYIWFPLFSLLWGSSSRHTILDISYKRRDWFSYTSTWTINLSSNKINDYVKQKL